MCRCCIHWALYSVESRPKPSAQGGKPKYLHFAQRHCTLKGTVPSLRSTTHLYPLRGIQHIEGYVDPAYEPGVEIQ